MSKRLIASILVSVFGLIGATGVALADTIGRYECNIIGQTSLEPIGDRDGHLLRSYDFPAWVWTASSKGQCILPTLSASWMVLR